MTVYIHTYIYIYILLVHWDNKVNNHKYKINKIYYRQIVDRFYDNPDKAFGCG